MLSRHRVVICVVAFIASVLSSFDRLSAADTAASAKKPSLAGNWLGTLKVAGTGLRLAVSVTTAEDGALKGTLTSVDQDGVPHRLDEISLKQEAVRFAFKQAGAVYEGTLNPAGTEITGKFKQLGAAFPLVFARVERAPEGRKHPQEPKPPYPYRVEEVKFENQAGHAKLAGTLTVPRTPVKPPAVLLVSGSGQQDRDEEIVGHRPFLVLADYLTRHGIAVLRVDDRGVGGSTGDVMHSTTQDFAGDARAGIDYLRSRPDIDAKKIGIIGHSEGGMIATLVATQSPDVAFVVMLAGPGLPGDQILLLQMVPLLKQAGASDALVERVSAFQRKTYAAVKEEPDAATLAKRLKAIYAEFLKTLSDKEKKQTGMSQDAADASPRVLGFPWFRAFLKYDPRPDLAHLKCPVLALIGQKDQQVPPKENLPQIEQALGKGGNKEFTVRELPGLNHLFQTCRTGSISEYAQIEETFAPSALQTIADWIGKRTSGTATASER